MSEITDEVASEDRIPGEDEIQDPGAPLTPAGRENLRYARQSARRYHARAAALEVENAGLKRSLGLARAGVEADSWLGQLVVTAAESDGVDDPDRVWTWCASCAPN